MNIPRLGGLVGTKTYTQCFLVDPGANPIGVVATNALEATVRS